MPRFLLIALILLAPEAAPADAQETRRDLNGDALPPGAVARLGSARLRHAGAVTGAGAFSPDGKFLVTTGKDHTIRFWDAATGKELRRLHDGAAAENVWRPVFSGDGKTVLALGRDRTICFWDADTGKIVRQFGADGAVHGIALSPDGKVIAHDRGGAHLILADAATGKVLLRVGQQGVESAAGKLPDALARQALEYPPSSPLRFSPDGKLVIGSLGDVYEAATGKLVRQVRQHEYGAVVAGLTADGKGLVTLDVGANESLPAEGVSIWDLASGKRLRNVSFPVADLDFRRVGVSSDGQLLATVTDRVRLWDGATGKPLRECERSGEAVGTLTFSPDGKTLASVGPSVVTLWDTDTGKLRLPLQREQKSVAALACSPDGKGIVTAQGQVIRRWDAESGKAVQEVAVPAHLTALACGPDNKIVAAGDLAGMITVWDLASGKERLRWKCDPEDEGAAPVAALAFAPDGKRLVGGGKFEGGVRVWDAANGKQLARLEQDTHLSHNVVYSPDGRHWAAGTFGGLANLFASPENARLRTFGRWGSSQQGEMTSLTFSPDGALLAWTQPGWRGVELEFLDAAPPARDEEGGPKVPALSVAFTPDGWALALGRADGSIALWDPAAEKEPPVLQSGAGAVRSLAFLAGGRLVSLHENGTALVWDVTAWLAPPAGAALSAKRLQENWERLSASRPVEAFRSMAAFARSGKAGVEYLAGRLRDTAGKMPSFKALLDDLGGASVLRQVYAKRELVGMGERAAPHLRLALGKAGPELRKRIEEALAEIAEKGKGTKGDGPEGGQADLLRASRALAVLGKVGTAEARAALDGLVRGAPGTWLAEEAQAALERAKK